MVTLSLLPTSLAVSRRARDVQRVEDQVQEMVEASPPELTAYFARVQLLVDSYGEALTVEASSDPGADEGSSSPHFDDRALEEALEPVREWLGASCTDTQAPR